jgi:nucleotide-binding universal stress UspA family protein
VIILVAIGEPASGRPTVTRAAELAMASQAAVVVLHVRERHYARGVVWDEPAPGDAAELLNESTYELRRRNITCRGTVRLARAGRVAEEIVSAALDLRADLIIVGRSPQWTLTHLMTANISQRVVRLAPTPVLVVPRANTIRLNAPSPR